MYFGENYETMRWGDNGEPLEQKRKNLHLFQLLGCNKIQVDEGIYLSDQAKSRLAGEITRDIVHQMQLIEEELWIGIVEKVADMVLQKMVDNPSDPTIEAIVEAIRNKKAARFDGISED